MNQLHWLGESMRGKRRLFALAMIMSMSSAALYIAYPFLTQMITDRVLVGTLLPDGTVFHDLAVLPLLLTLLIGSQLLRSADRFGVNCLLEHVSQNTIQRLRLEIYQNLSEQDPAFYDEYRTGDLMTRLTGDMDMVRHTISWISYNVVENLSLFIFSNIFFFTINTKLTLTLLAITPVLLFCTYFYSRTVYPLYAQLREKLSMMNSIAQENIAGNKVVRAFAREDYECKKFDASNGDFRNANLTASLYWLKFFPFIEGFSQCMNILIVVVGGIFIIRGEMTPGQLMAFSLLSWGISGPMREMGMYINDLQRFFASAAKVMEVHHLHSRITSPKDGRKQQEPLRGEIEFKDFSYRYGYSGTPFALRDINLKIQPGETLAIMGVTGSGKTTLINAIVRLVDATKGSILVDGTDVRKWDLQDLRRHIGVTTQDVMLYSNTVDANIAYGDPELPEDEVQYFAKLAAAQFVERLSQGYETVIGERGTGLSGGQKQRIALARALAARPSILILDDTTSAVDMETEHYIQQSLKQLPYSCTKLIIAQRISSVRHADKIIVMDKGSIVEMGTHRELAAAGGYYSEICRLQGVGTEVSVVGSQK